MLKLEVVHALVDLVAKEIVKDAVSRSDYDVSVLQFLYVFLCMLRQVLAHVAAVTLGPQDGAKLLEFLYPPLLLEDCKLLLAWQDRKLVRNVE